VPARWALRVLSWLAFGVAAYLAWKAITQASVAGCVVGSNQGCDAVLNSPWSKWLGFPVAVAGLGCYATLAGMSVLLGIATIASRWITTAFMMLAFLAAGASLWFIGIQIFAIGDICPWCVTADLCGIAIGAISAWATFSWWNGTRRLRQSGSSSTNLMALRGAMPTGSRKVPAAAPVAMREAQPVAPRPAPVAAARSVPLVGALPASAGIRRHTPPPSFPIAFGGALAMLVVLIGGQIVFPAKSFNVQQVALKDSIELNSSTNSAGDSASTSNGETHVANRIPAEGETEPSDEPPYDAALANAADNKDEVPATNGDGKNGAEEAPPTTAASTEPKKERKLKFLGGKLTLDTYEHPIIGSPEAPHIVVELVSYDCPHCRKANKFMKQALSRYGEEVALIVLTIPLEQRCNRLITDPAASHTGSCTTAGLACLIAKLKPTSFPRFHDYLMSGSDERPPSIGSIVAKAYGMADRTKLRELRENKEIAKQLEGYVDLFAMLRKQNTDKKEVGLPLQILGDTIMSGGIDKAADVYAAWEKNLGVKPR
jgi:uncharacterized membrane protein